MEPLHAGGAVFDEHLPEDEPVGDDWRQATVVADPDWQVEEAWDEDDMDVAAIPPPPVAPPQEPVPEPPVVEELPAMRPAGLSAPRNGVPDDLQRIRGIGKKNEALLNSLGIFHFGQIAAWTPAEIRWVGLQIKFPERIERDDWIGQATILASGGRTGYIKAEDRKRAEDEDDNYGPPG